MNTIEVDGLSRTFNGRLVVDELTFIVQEGEIFGFLGPNGAGKTTTIRLLTGQIHPTSGRASVSGFDIVHQRQQLKRCIGVVFEEQNLYERFSGRENLAFSASLYGVDSKRVEEVLEQVSLREWANDRVQKYSNGMRQRLVIARALLHKPRVLFLDEPTRGLDPIVAREIRLMITSLVDQGMTVFLTTHYMEEAEHLCRQVAFIDQGRIVGLDTPDRLKASYGKRGINLTLLDGAHLYIPFDETKNGEHLGELAASGRILTAHSAEASLEDVFVQLTGKRLAE
ncbi:MAG: ABC transporter ATP-binding protein [Anaerolineales bacterium]